jgi:hypothetical protein
MSEIMWYKTYSPEYFATEDGTIRTFDRCEYMPYKNSVRKIHRKGKILKPIKMENGYLYIDISCKGKVKRTAVHRIVSETFLSKNINKKHIHHIDGNKENNAVSNLEIIDPIIHCREHSFERVYSNKTGYRCVHNHYGRYRGSIQRSGKKTIYTKIYDTPNEAYEEVQFILKSRENLQ